MTALCAVETHAPVQKKPRTSPAALFSLSHVTTKRPPPPTPTPQDIRVERPTPSPAPPRVATKLRPRLVMGIDIETAGWEYECRVKGEIGQSGPDCLFCTPQAVGRLLKHSKNEQTVRQALPSPNATKYHNIKQERAVAEGLPLDLVLRSSW